MRNIPGIRFSGLLLILGCFEVNLAWTTTLGAGMNLPEGKVANQNRENPGKLFIYDDLVPEK